MVDPQKSSSRGCHKSFSSDIFTSTDTDIPTSLALTIFQLKMFYKSSSKLHLYLSFLMLRRLINLQYFVATFVTCWTFSGKNHLLQSKRSVSTMMQANWCHQNPMKVLGTKNQTTRFKLNHLTCQVSPFQDLH